MQSPVGAPLKAIARLGIPSVLGALLALPAAAGSVTDSHYNVTVSTSGSQFLTSVPGASTFVDSATLAGYSGSLVTPTASLSGGLLNNGANPAGGVTGGSGSGNWINSGSGGSLTISFANPEGYFGLLWGSVDDSNTLKLYNGSTLVATYTGLQMVTDGASNYPSPGSFVGFTAQNAASDITKAVLSDSTANGFEVVNFAAGPPAPVPLPQSLALLSGGLALVGGLARRRRKAPC